MNQFTRRDALSALTLGGAAIATSHVVLAKEATGVNTAPMAPTTTASFPLALAGAHSVVPLPFSPGKLHGLSEKMLVSHHDNNYASAVKNLNRVEQELAKLSPETPPFLVAGLRDKELTFRNSKTLHEAYFANLGGDGRRSGAIESALSHAYGSTGKWEEQFRATGLGLGGGSGWVILAFELDTGALRTVAGGNHTQVLANAVPLLIMDMYEHAYQMDFGAAVPKYIDAFFANVRWDEVNHRLERAARTSAAWRA